MQRLFCIVVAAYLNIFSLYSSKYIMPYQHIKYEEYVGGCKNGNSLLSIRLEVSQLLLHLAVSIISL